MPAEFQQFNNVPDLPYTIKQDGKPDIIFDWMPFEELSKAHDFWLKFAFQDDGCSRDEFSGVDDFVEKAYGRLTYYCYEVGSGKIVGFYQLCRASLCRGLDTIYNSGYAIRDPEYKGVAPVALGLIFNAARARGQRGALSRSTPRSTGAYQGGYVNGSLQLGCIPMSVYVPNVGWVDDLIIHFPFGSWKKKPERHFPPLPRCTTPFEDSLPASYAACIEQKKYRLRDQTLTVCVANESQRLALERMLYDAAMKGQSYGLDEFDPDGTYARRTFRSSITIVLVDKKGTCLGGMFCGSSIMSRGKDSPILAFYVILPPQTSSGGSAWGSAQEVADILYPVVRTLARHHKCYGTMTDILTTDHLALDIAYNHGMLTVGSIPDSTYLKGQGYTGSLLMHQKFIPTPSM